MPPILPIIGIFGANFLNSFWLLPFAMLLLWLPTPKATPHWLATSAKARFSLFPRGVPPVIPVIINGNDNSLFRNSQEVSTSSKSISGRALCGSVIRSKG